MIQTYDGKTFIEVSGDKVRVQHGDQNVLLTDDGVTIEADRVDIGGTSGKKLMMDNFIALYNAHTHLPGGLLSATSRANSGHATSKTRAE